MAALTVKQAFKPANQTAAKSAQLTFPDEKCCAISERPLW